MHVHTHLQSQQDSAIDLVFDEGLCQVFHVNRLQILIHHILLTPLYNQPHTRYKVPSIHLTFQQNLPTTCSGSKSLTKDSTSLRRLVGCVVIAVSAAIAYNSLALACFEEI